jgi:hypothetical protein
VCSEKVLDSRPGDHLPGTDVLTRYPFFYIGVMESSETTILIIIIVINIIIIIMRWKLMMIITNDI